MWYHDAMIRTQISLTEEQHEVLLREAGRRGISMAALIREAVDGHLDERRRRRARLLEAAGAAESRLGDLAERHDDYLASG
jgi:hypothetical protein